MGFSSRKRTKSIYTGSKLSVPGQGIYTVKLTKPEKVQVNTQVDRVSRPTPTPSTSVNVIPTPTPTPVPSTSVTPTPTITVTPTITPTVTVTPTITPTVTVTPTITPTVTVTPTITPTPSCARPGGLTDFTFLSSITSPIFFAFSESLGNACGANYIFNTFSVSLGGSSGKALSFNEGQYVYSFFGTGCEQFDDGYYIMPIDNSVSQVQNGYLSFPTCPLPFISIWRTTSPNETITLPYGVGGTYDGVIDWGDGTWSANTYDNRTHSYVTPGDYTIKVVGTIVGFRFNYTGDNTKIREITQWGNLNLGDNGSYFAGCSNLVLTGVTDVLNLQGTYNLNGMFVGCAQITTINRINEWNVSNVTTMGAMFYNTQFNQDISGWDVSSVNNMGVMFLGTPFNQPIGNWDVSSVTNMGNMFGASFFNQDISGWNVSGVTDMAYMFSNSPFNQPIGNWDVSSVTNMVNMFQGNTSFNQDISSWDVSNVTDMERMFYTTSNFNQDLSSWCVPLIPSLPTEFDLGAASWVLPRPIWGTCPP